MSSIPNSTDRLARPAPSAKQTLFCAACGHRSPADGDWTVRPRGPAHVAYYCPRCAKTIMVRPRDETELGP